MNGRTSRILLPYSQGRQPLADLANNVTDNLDNMEHPKEKSDEKASRGPPDAILQHLAQINGAIAVIQARMEEQDKQAKKDFDDHRRMREEDMRMILARVASVGTNVSYLRENVCEQLREQVKRSRFTWGGNL